MKHTNERILVTGASGHLGRRVAEKLLGKVEASQIVASVRSRDKAGDLAAKGIEVREADYADLGSVRTALRGIDRVLLVSSNDLGHRFDQHRNVIDAAKEEGVKLFAYTSILHGDASPLGLRVEHVQTENYLRASGLPWVFLRNGWYHENYLAVIPSVLQQGALYGCAGKGRVSSASREDYAEAAAAVLAGDGANARGIFELAGDEAYTLQEWAGELSRQTGRKIEYRDLSEAEYFAHLLKAGMPEPVASLLSDSDLGASKGGLFDDRHALSRLIGHDTTPLRSAMAEALRG